MRFVSFEMDGKATLGVREGDHVRVIGDETLESLLARGVRLDEYASANITEVKVQAAGLKYLPPLSKPPKIICVGLNYADHTKESKYEQPDYPTLFLRVNTSLVAHEQPMIRPSVTDSEGLDYEGEVAVVLGTAVATFRRRTRSRTSRAMRSSTTARCASISSRRRSGP